MPVTRKGFIITNQEVRQSARPAFFYGYIVVVAAFFVIMLMFGAFYSFGVFFKPLSTEFGWSRAVTSGAFSAKMLMGGIFSIVMGRLNDRLGPRLVLTIGGLLIGLGYLLMSQISTLWQLYLFYGILVGIGMSTGYVPLISTVARWFAKRRGMMTGIVVSGVGAGTLVMPPIANWLILEYGWRTSYIILGTVSLALIILAAQFLRRDPSQMGLVPYGESEVSKDGLGLTTSGLSLKEAFLTRQFWMFMAIMACFAYCIQAVMVHIALQATELGASPTMAASVLAIIGGGSIIGRIVLGGTGDRIGNRLTAIFCFILYSAALVWITATTGVWTLYIFAIIFSLGYGGFVALQSPMVAELFGLGSHGVIMGCVAFGSTIGGAIGPVLSGYIFDVTSSYNQAFLLCAILAVIGLILVWFLRLTKPSQDR